MTPEKAREILSNHADGVNAIGRSHCMCHLCDKCQEFLNGYELGVRESAEILQASMIKHSDEDGPWIECTKIPLELKREILESKE